MDTLRAILGPQAMRVMVLHMALVPVNLWRLNQAFQRKPSHPATPAMPAQRANRQPSNKTAGCRHHHIG